MKTSIEFQSSIRTVAYLTMLFLIIQTATAYADPAASGGSYNTAAFVSETNKIREFLFGPGSKIVAFFAAAWGIVQSFLSGSIKPVLTFGAIALAANFLPKFIDMVF